MDNSQPKIVGTWFYLLLLFKKKFFFLLKQLLHCPVQMNHEKEKFRSKIKRTNITVSLVLIWTHRRSCWTRWSDDIFGACKILCVFTHIVLSIGFTFNLSSVISTLKNNDTWKMNKNKIKIWRLYSILGVGSWVGSTCACDNTLAL